MVMEFTTEQLSPIVICQGCGRDFHHLASHLLHRHDGMTTEGYRNFYKIGPKEPLHSRQYAESRRKVALEPQNRTIETLCLQMAHRPRKDAIKSFLDQGLLTTGVAAFITLLASDSLRAAIQRGVLKSSLVSLVDFEKRIRKGEGNCSAGGVPVNLITIPNLEKYCRGLRGKKSRETALQRIAATKTI